MVNYKAIVTYDGYRSMKSAALRSAEEAVEQHESYKAVKAGVLAEVPEMDENPSDVLNFLKAIYGDEYPCK